MVLKRKVCGGEEGQGQGKLDFKRKYGIPSFYGSGVNRTSPQELGSILEPFIRNIVKEEIGFALRNFQSRPSLIDTTSCVSRFLHLCFENKLPTTIFTGCKVESEDICPLKVVLRDSSGKTITSGPFSSAKLTLVVLDGDLNPDECEDLTAHEFNKRTVREREGRRPLVTGTRSLTLRQGVGYLDDIVFTDNSSWIRSGKFRLGVKVLHNNNTGEIKEGISNAFKVKDQRGESYKKNHPPSLFDEVWRLERIGKGGASHKRLASHGISTVKDFLRLYHTNPCLLRHIMGVKTSNKAFDFIIRHAEECCLDNDELYVYRGDDGSTLILNSIYQVMGVILDGENIQCMDALNQSQKRLVEKLKHNMCSNLNHLVPLGGQSSFLTSSLQSPSLPASYYSAPSIMPQNVNFTANQADELEMQINPCPVVMSSTHAHGFHELQVSDTETSPQLGECSNPTFSDDFVVDSCTGNQSFGYDWDTGFSLGPLDSTVPHVVSENFHVDSPVWQGNGFIMSPGNEALGLMASNFDIRISRKGRSKVCWNKIRAVVKWRMIKSKGKKKGKAFKYKY